MDATVSTHRAGRTADSSRPCTRTRIRSVLCAALLNAAANLALGATLVVDTLDDAADPPFDADNACGTGRLDDLPGADGHVSLREAIIAANTNADPDMITFAPSLSGGTIVVGFGDAGSGLKRPLPFLCGGRTTLDGDLNGDGGPDVTVRASATLPASAIGIDVRSSGNVINGLAIDGFPSVGLLVFHPFFHSTEASAADNTVSHNVVTGGGFPILLQASFADPLIPGHIANTTIRGNVASGASTDGILVYIADGAGSSITDTSIVDNLVTDNGRFGILVTPNATAAGHDSAIDDTTIRGNEIVGNGASGIAAFAFAGRGSRIQRLTIDANLVRDNAGGIAVTSGVCGATQSSMEATITGNEVPTSGISAVGGSNFLCPTNPPALASGNMLTATIRGNTVFSEAGPGIAVAGGSVGGERNAVTAEVSDNTVAGLNSIAIVGGNGVLGDESGPAHHNTVDAMVRGNRASNSLLGILVSGGASGVASDNAVEATVENNSACRSLLADIQCAGGFPGAPGFPANVGAGNTVSGRIRGNLATRIIVNSDVPGNTCATQQSGNAPCRAGDANCDGRLSAADLIAIPTLIAAEERATCELDDATMNRILDAADVPPTLAGLFAVS